MFEPLSMLAVFGPTAVKAVEAIYQRYIAPDAVKPATVADAVALGEIENRKLEIITTADHGGNTYKWVEAIRKLQRPVVVFATLAAFLYKPTDPAIAAVFQTVMWYLFGERVRMPLPFKMK